MVQLILAGEERQEGLTLAEVKRKGFPQHLLLATATFQPSLACAVSGFSF